MRITVVLISFLTIISCTKKYNLSKIVKENKNNYNVFICSSYKDMEANKFYGATTPKQVDLIVKGLKLKLWRGYWDGAEIDGIIITNNNLHLGDIPQNIIRKSNFNEFKDSLTVFRRDDRVCDKKKLLTLIDSLQSNSIPYYLFKDISNFYGEQFFKIKYDLGVNKYPSKKERSTVKSTNDSIINLFHKAYPGREIRISEYRNYRDGRAETNIAVSANGKIEINNLDSISYSEIKSIKQITVENYEPIDYYINYFVKRKNNI